MEPTDLFARKEYADALIPYLASHLKSVSALFSQNLPQIWTPRLNLRPSCK